MLFWRIGAFLRLQAQSYVSKKRVFRDSAMFSEILAGENLVLTGADIQPWLEREGLSLHQAEKRLGIHRMTLYRWMHSGEVLPRSTQMVFLAAQAGFWQVLPQPKRAVKARARNAVKDLHPEAA